MPKGKNVIWCGTLQLAWNHLGKDILHAPPNVQGAETVASRLNESQLREGDLPAGSYFATAGFVKDGIVEKVESKMKQRFRKEVQISPMGPDGILAYAYLEANALFTVPFFDNSQVFHFADSAGKKSVVTSFGIEEKHEYAYNELREQVEVLYSLRNENNFMELEEFVVDPCRDSSPNQIVIASIPRKATLLETLDDVEKKTREFAQDRMRNATKGSASAMFCLSPTSTGR